ncbi:hypothetical protein CU098_008327 [Rhizopus stolonifer]|uniref:Uncharacterized protein n=1 Tax=Rhizopus stolonifer TaxID=4846 RepID=A0A367KJW2_RHIST|nr:hypothetical protein CU098_008327 [Rhizopus stolonifer]
MQEFWIRTETAESYKLILFFVEYKEVDVDVNNEEPMDTVDQLRQQFQFDDSGLDFFGAQDDIEAEKDVDETQEEEQRLHAILKRQREEEFNEIASVVELAITRIDSVVNRHPTSVPHKRIRRCSLPTTQLAVALTKSLKKKKYWGVYYLNKVRLSQNVISSTVDLSRSTVQTIIKRIKKTGSPLPGTAPGPKPKITKKGLALLKLTILRDPFLTIDKKINPNLACVLDTIAALTKAWYGVLELTSFDMKKSEVHVQVSVVHGLIKAIYKADAHHSPHCRNIKSNHGNTRPDYLVNVWQNRVYKYPQWLW